MIDVEHSSPKKTKRSSSSKANVVTPPEPKKLDFNLGFDSDDDDKVIMSNPNDHRLKIEGFSCNVFVVHLEKGLDNAAGYTRPLEEMIEDDDEDRTNGRFFKLAS